MLSKQKMAHEDFFACFIAVRPVIGIDGAGMKRQSVPCVSRGSPPVATEMKSYRGSLHRECYYNAGHRRRSLKGRIMNDRVLIVVCRPKPPFVSLLYDETLLRGMGQAGMPGTY